MVQMASLIEKKQCALGRLFSCLGKEVICLGKGVRKGVRLAQRLLLRLQMRALELLKAKLVVIQQEQQAAEIAQIRGDAVKAEWGQQIRNYVFHPYKLVKDVRTGEETSDVGGVMDGALDAFMQAYLRHKGGRSARAGDV